VGLLFLSAFAAYYLYTLKRDSADGRLLVWKVALTMVPTHPITGLGQGGFHASVLKYQSLYFQTHPDKIPTEGRLADQVAYAFNDPLQITAEQGMAGLLLFMAIIAMAIKTGRVLLEPPGDKTFIAGPLTAMGVILVSGLFSYPLTVLPVQILFYVSLGIISGEATAIKTEPVSRLPAAAKWGIALVCFVAGLFYINYAVNTYQAYKMAYTAKDNGFKADGINMLKPYQAILQHENRYVLMQADELLSQGKVNQAIAGLEQAKKFSTDKGIYYGLAKLYTYQKNYTQAERQYQFICYALPQLLRPKYLLALFYHNTGQTDKFEQLALQIISFKSKVVSPETTGMQLEINGLLKQHQ
jgi:O-antigen polymerase